MNRVMEQLRRVPMPPERMIHVALPVVVALVAILTITPWPVGAFQDDAMYTVLAKSLAEGRGFRFLNLPGEPNATHFPPAYPLVLSLIWRAWPSFPDNIVAFKFLNAFYLAAAASGAYVFARRRFRAPVPAALAVALIGTLSIVVLLVTGVVMSEPMFLALLFPALLVAEKSVESGRPRDALVAGLLLGLLAMVRTLGVFAVPALGLVLLLRGRFWAAVAAGVGAAVFLVPWQLWVGAHQGEIAPVMVGKFGSYGSWLVDGYREGGVEFAKQVVLKNTEELEGMLSYYFLPVQALWPRSIVLFGVLGFTLLGTGRFRRNAPVTLWFLAVYTLVIMLWPFEPARFTLAVWPLWPLMVGCGVLAAWDRLGRVAAPARIGGRAAVAVLVVALVGGSAQYNLTGYTRKWWVTAQRDAGKRAKPIVEWAARYTDSTTVLSTEDDLIVYLYANRKSVPTSTFLPKQRVRFLTDPEDVQVVRDIFTAYRPSWFLVGSQQGFRTASTLAGGATPVLRYVGRTPDVLIYQHQTP
ncbi:MAG: glycosyltransferase family 39 protein [Gemmatimonadetes bacterium]|nr:glycosyltransferase family 39 protein [Gemmatimonadota bacterium]